MRLAPKAVVVGIWRAAIAWATVFGVAIAAVFGIPALQLPLVYVLIGIAALAVLAEVAWLTPATVRSFRYTVTSEGVRTSEGVLFTRENFLPMQQILIVERRQGPLLRSVGLVRVRLRVPGTYIDIDGVTDDAFIDIQRDVRAALASVDDA